jgi:transcriptional regulator with XRE-family HTH domain
MVTEQIGARLRDARSARGLSVRGLAQTLGVSASLISQIETGKTQPSVSTLYAIVTALGVSIDELLGVVTAPDPAPASTASPVVQRAADNPVIEMENGVRWERLAAGDGAADVLLVRYEPGASSSVEGRLMRHAGIEYAYLLEGELTLRLEFDTFVLRAGDSLHFDSVRPHMYENRTDAVARGLWFVTGRREQHQTMPSAAGAEAVADGSRPASAVDVLQAMDRLRGD